MTIYVDTREQKPWEFDELETESVALETGDYTPDESIGAVERKTADDFLGSITWERDRFEAECERASSFEEEMVIIVERPWSHFENNKYYQNVHPNAVEATVESWERQYNVRFVFETNRWSAKQRALEIMDEWA